MLELKVNALLYLTEILRSIVKALPKHDVYKNPRNVK